MSSSLSAVRKDPPGVHHQTSSAATEAYAQPRRSHRVKDHVVSADGDTWYEKLAVCEGVSKDGQPRLLVKSSYKNSRTGEKVWDEPPSGASHVQHATADMRRQAEVRLQELHWTLEMIPPESSSEAAAAVGPPATAASPKKKGLFSRFKGKKDKAAVDVSKDLNLQKAIARSMADQYGGGGGSGIPREEDDRVFYSDPATTGEFDDELAMAKALSLSEAAGGATDASLLRALEESKLDSADASTPVRSKARISYQNSPEPNTAEESKVEHDFPRRTLSDLSEDFPSEHGVEAPIPDFLLDGIEPTAAAAVAPGPKEQGQSDRKKVRRFFGGRKSA